MTMWDEVNQIYKEETILDYYLNRARQLRMLYYKTGEKKYDSMARRIAKEGRKKINKEIKQ